MKSARSVKAVFPFILLAMLAGCDSKGDKAGSGAVAPDGKTAAAPAQGPAGTAGTAGPAGPAATVVTEKDKADAKTEAARLVSQLKAGEFTAIYQQSADAFKELGNEKQFVDMMQQTRKKTGALKSFKETSMETGTDLRQMVNYSVQYDNVKSTLRLSFYRSKNGKMELVGLNQKDEVVKKKDAVVKK